MGSAPDSEARGGHADLAGTCEIVWQRASARLGGGVRGLAIFGSRARGEEREDSDLDVLVIVDGLPTDFDERAALLWSLKRGLPHPPSVQLVVRTVDEFERDVTPLHLDIALDARVVREKDGYLTAKLARLRELLREARLVRRADLRWRWLEEPKRRDWAITWQGVRK